MRKSPRLRLFGLLALGILVLNSVVAEWRPAAVHAQAVPAGLPGHFAFGLAAQPDNNGIYGWMPNSGIPWDYAYQYLAGGVNTNSGWEVWNTSGQFPLYYAQGAASHHYIPVFPYYELLQSNGTCGSCGETQKDLANLNTASTMASYFANFRLLMQRLGSGTYNGIAGFGKTAIVQVEPDLSGYAEQAVLNNSQCYGFCTGSGNNPALLKAAVASSGDADVTAYPNTYQGFNWALLHLRDRYAPNVLLAFHVSDWATGSDVGSSNSTTLNATSLGQEAGSFAAQSGITGVPSGVSSYDLLFNDVSDRDAAYYKYVYSDSSRWWDRLNVTFPNFHRWEDYVRAMGQAAGRSVMVWQVPEGNQYFDTVNNTDGHYQDNRAEYFFGHVAELAAAGVIGVLFGAGNGGSTVQSDGKGDGVTNPASFCTSDGMSSGQICNNHTSTVSDDDGGYLRMEGQQYYTGGTYSLGGGASPTPVPTATRTATGTSTPVASATKAPGSTATVTPSPTVRRSTSTPIASATATVRAPSATATPTASGRLPGATATATASTAAPKFRDASVLQPAAPLRGKPVVISTLLTQTGGTLSNGIVDIEVYNNANWAKVGQFYYSGQNLTTGQSKTYTFTWTVPAASGQYTVMVGVFGANWAPNYYWDSASTHFAVQ